MIFVGDIAYPNKDIVTEEKLFPKVFEGQTIVGNLEGALTPKDYSVNKVVFNDFSLLGKMSHAGDVIFSLANNHITDIENGIENTLEFCKKNSIPTVGAGRNLMEASRPLLLEVDGVPCFFLSFGWDVIQCKYAKQKSPGVNPLEPKHILRSVTEIRETNPQARIILLFHWGYELELYPLPMHRELAFECIELGADIVVGSHSHCVQGIERHKGKPIVYGLGNWFFPWGIYWQGTLRFPDFSKLELAFEWDPGTEKARCHWFLYDGKQTLSHLSSEPVDGSKIVKAKTPFKDMNHKEYISWFKKHRRKRRGLPVYRTQKDIYGNKIRDTWVGVRGILVPMVKSILGEKTPR